MTPPPGPAGSTGDRLLVGSGAVVLVAMLASFAPTPLYPLYRERWELGDVAVGIIFAAYPVGVLTVLVLLGGLSDRFGRRRTLLVGLAALVVSLGAMAAAPSVEVLTAGRLVQGFGAGLVTGTGAATLMELHPSGAFLNTACLSIGMAFGPLLAGLLAEQAAAPLVVPYAAIAALLLLPAVLLGTARVPPVATGGARLLRRVRVPRDRRGAFCVAAGAVVVVNLGTAVYGSFGPDIAASVGWGSQAEAGRLVSVVLLVMAATQFAGRRLDNTTSTTAGTLLAVLAWAVAAVAAGVGSSGLLVLGSVLVGASAGLCLLGSAGLVGQLSPRDRRAETYSAYLLVSFTAMALVALAAAPVVARSVPLVLGATSAVAAVLAVGVAVGSRRLVRGELPLARVQVAP